METIKSRKVLEHYCEEHHIHDCFGSCRPHLLLLRYRPGELLVSPFSHGGYFQFIVGGTVDLYEVKEEGSFHTVETAVNGVKILGDMEIINPDFKPLFVEARTEVIAVALNISQYREQLMNDPVFLRFLCSELAEKLRIASENPTTLPLKERITISLRHMEPGQQIRGIGKLAESVNVSRRQMIRVLNEFCDEGILLHEKKGVYVLLIYPFYYSFYSIFHF